MKVIILAGQSNMVGRGAFDNGVGGLRGAIGSLRYKAETDPANFGNLLDGNGNWIVRNDVRIIWGNARNAELIGNRFFRGWLMEAWRPGLEGGGYR